MRYKKRRLGPAPVALVPIREQLVQEGAIRVEKLTTPDRHVQQRTVALRPAAMGLFTEDEVALVDEVIEELRGQTAAEVSDASHDVRWKVLQLDDAMPYELAYLSNEGLTERDRQRTAELAAQFGW